MSLNPSYILLMSQGYVYFIMMDSEFGQNNDAGARKKNQVFFLESLEVSMFMNSLLYFPFYFSTYLYKSPKRYSIFLDVTYVYETTHCLVVFYDYRMFSASLSMKTGLLV